MSRAAAELIDLDPRELGVLSVPTGSGPQSLGALIYDNVPGGAGHVQAVLEMGRRWLEVARDVLFVDTAHDRRCDTACLDCVLEFDVNASSEESLDRRTALQTLDRILGGGVTAQTGAGRADPAGRAPDLPRGGGGEESPSRLSNEDRIERARQRRGPRRQSGQAPVPDATRTMLEEVYREILRANAQHMGPNGSLPPAHCRPLPLSPGYYSDERG